MTVSVIISTYNRPAWLQKVIWGYECQTYEDFELIIADDGSQQPTKILDAAPARLRSTDHDAPRISHPDRKAPRSGPAQATPGSAGLTPQYRADTSQPGRVLLAVCRTSAEAVASFLCSSEYAFHRAVGLGGEVCDRGGHWYFSFGCHQNHSRCRRRRGRAKSNFPEILSRVPPTAFNTVGSKNKQIAVSV